MGIGIDVSTISKMLKVLIFYMMSKGLSGRDTCMGIGVVGDGYLESKIQI